jgi:hypothetical protein
VVQEDRDELRGILQIHVELDRCVTSTVHVAGEDGSLESEVSGEAKDAYPRILLCNLPQQCKGAICAVIICDDKLESEAIGELLENRMETLEKRTNV